MFTENVKITNFSSKPTRCYVLTKPVIVCSPVLAMASFVLGYDGAVKWESEGCTRTEKMGKHTLPVGYIANINANIFEAE